MKGKKGIGFAPRMAMVLAISLSMLGMVSEKPKSKNPGAQTLIDKAWAGKNQDDAKRLDEQIASLEEANRLDPDNPSILTYLSRVYFERGMTEGDKGPTYREKAKKYFERGYELAKKSLTIRESSLGHYLAAINKGASVSNGGIVEQARSFIEIKAHMEWIGKHDPNFHYGAYARFWLDCYENAPDKIIAIAGVSKEEACGRLDAAIRREPRYLENHFYKLNSCVPPEDKAGYLAALEAALAVDPKSLPAEQGSNNYYHGKLHKLWKTKTGKEHP